MPRENAKDRVEDLIGWATANSVHLSITVPVRGERTVVAARDQVRFLVKDNNLEIALREAIEECLKASHPNQLSWVS